MSLLEVSSAKPFPFDYLQNKELMALSIVLLFLLPPGKIEHKLIFEAAEQTSRIGDIVQFCCQQIVGTSSWKS